MWAVRRRQKTSDQIFCVKNETGQLEVNLVQPTLIMEHPTKKPLHCTQGEGDANRSWELVSFAWVGGGRKNDGLVSDLELLIINFIWGQVFFLRLGTEKKSAVG